MILNHVSYCGRQIHWIKCCIKCAWSASSTLVPTYKPHFLSCSAKSLVVCDLFRCVIITVITIRRMEAMTRTPPTTKRATPATNSSCPSSSSSLSSSNAEKLTLDCGRRKHTYISKWYSIMHGPSLLVTYFIRLCTIFSWNTLIQTLLLPLTVTFKRVDVVEGFSGEQMVVVRFEFAFFTLLSKDSTICERAVALASQSIGLASHCRSTTSCVTTSGPVQLRK